MIDTYDVHRCCKGGIQKRPQFEDLPPEQQRLFGNGVGPRWFPESWRRFLTGTASWFFCEASWRHHDFGYAVGGNRRDRARCDWKFLTAMLRDAIAQRVLLIVPAILLALTFYLAVRLGGQFNAFRYRENYASIEEILGKQPKAFAPKIRALK